MNIHEVVKKLVGPIQPVGECHTDVKRYENLKTMTDLAAKIVEEIRDVAVDKDRHEHSMQKAGKHAAEFITITQEADRDAIEKAHMAGQLDAGVDPGYSNARAYYDGLKEKKE